MNPHDLTPEQAAELAARLRTFLPALVRVARRLEEDFRLWEQEMAS